MKFKIIFTISILIITSLSLVNSVAGQLSKVSPPVEMNRKEYTQEELNKLDELEILNPKLPYRLGFISESFEPVQKVEHNKKIIPLPNVYLRLGCIFHLTKEQVNDLLLDFKQRNIYKSICSKEFLF